MLHSDCDRVSVNTHQEKACVAKRQHDRPPAANLHEGARRAWDGEISKEQTRVGPDEPDMCLCSRVTPSPGPLWPAQPARLLSSLRGVYRSNRVTETTEQVPQLSMEPIQPIPALRSVVRRQQPFDGYSRADSETSTPHTAGMLPPAGRLETDTAPSRPLLS